MLQVLYFITDALLCTVLHAGGGHVWLRAARVRALLQLHQRARDRCRDRPPVQLPQAAVRAAGAALHRLLSGQAGEAAAEAATGGGGEGAAAAVGYKLEGSGVATAVSLMLGG